MEAISSRPVSSGRTGRTAPGLVLVGIAGLSLGFLTAYAQEWLPDELGSLANSAGSWALVAFTLALLAVDGRTAVSFGCLALVALLIGYILGANVRGFASGRSLIVFWGAAAVVAGPLIGLAAHRVRTEHGPMAALGIGAIQRGARRRRHLRAGLHRRYHLSPVLVRRDNRRRRSPYVGRRAAPQATTGCGACSVGPPQ